MPIFEYVCSQCKKRFELLVHKSTAVACPSCRSTRLEKQLSVFNASTKGQAAARGEFPAAPCGACGDPRGPGSCSTN